MDQVADIGDANDDGKRANDLRAVDGDDVGHQAEHTDRGELDDHHHDLHDNFERSVDQITDLLALFASGQNAGTEEDGNDDDRQHVGFDHRLKQVVREDADDDGHDGRSFLGFILQSAQLCAGKRRECTLEDVDQHKANHNGDGGSAHIVHKRLDADAADTLEVLQRDNAVSNGEQHNGYNEELQQVDVDRANGFDPLGCELGVLQEQQTDKDTGDHADEYPCRQAQFLLFFHCFLSPHTLIYRSSHLSVLSLYQNVQRV